MQHDPSTSRASLPDELSVCSRRVAAGELSVCSRIQDAQGRDRVMICNN